MEIGTRPAAGALHELNCRTLQSICPDRAVWSGPVGRGERGFRNTWEEATIRSAEAAVVSYGTWRSPVAHCNGVAGVAGSNPAVPIENERARGLARSRSGRRDLAVAPRRWLGALRSNPAVGALRSLGAFWPLPLAGGSGHSGQVPPSVDCVVGVPFFGRCLLPGGSALPVNSGGRYSPRLGVFRSNHVLQLRLRLPVLGRRLPTAEAEPGWARTPRALFEPNTNRLEEAGMSTRRSLGVLT